METIYRLNADELDNKFNDSLKSVFKNKDIEITVSEIDETEYLLRSTKNKELLSKAVSDVKNKIGIVTPNQDQFQ